MTLRPMADGAEVGGDEAVEGRAAWAVAAWAWTLQSF